MGIVVRDRIIGIRDELMCILREMTGERLYLIAFAIFIAEQSLESTMWELPYRPMQLIRYTGILLLLIKLICYDSHRLWESLLFAFFIITGVLIKLKSGETSAFFYLLFLYGARGVKFEKILKVWFICSGIVVGLTVIGSYMETVIDLVYHVEGYMRTADESEEVARHSLGIIYPTDLSAHFMGLMMAAMYLYRRRIKIWHCLIGLGFIYWLYRMTYARNNAICMIMLCVGYIAILAYMHLRSGINKKYSKKRSIPALFFYTMPVCAVISFAMNHFYDPEKESLINKWFATRLPLGKKGLELYPPNLFGQHVIMQGGGRSTDIKYDKYFFLDCSYLYTGLRVGMVFLMIIIVASIIACYKHKRDAFFVLSIAVISIFGIAEHHIDALEYTPFLLAAAAVADEADLSRSLYKYRSDPPDIKKV